MAELPLPSRADPGAGERAALDVLPPTRELARVLATHHGPPSEDAHLPLITAPGSKAAADFRMLRYRLERSNRSRIVGITSPGRGEGKTTCAMNLALAIAEHSAEHVLLVEANLQQPKLAALLDFSPQRCFSEQMHTCIGRPDYQWQAVSAFLPNLHVLAIDPERAESQLLSAQAFQSALDQLRQSRYAHIILDCPAALGSADMNIIVDRSDGIVLVALAGHTRRSALHQSVKALEPVTVLGTVLVGG